MAAEVLIAGAATVPGMRRPPETATTRALLAQAFAGALASAGLEPGDVDGLGVASFGLGPDRAVDLAWQLGLPLRWVMDDPVGLNLVAHAAQAIRTGDASVVVIVGGDNLVGGFGDMSSSLNAVTRDYLSVLPTGGPNALFALLTQAHMAAYGLDREAYARVALAQRAWAQRNPAAVYRSALTLADYLAAPIVADPLCLLDCVPLVAGAEAIVLTAPTVHRRGRGVAVRAIETVINHDQQAGDGLSTGLGGVADRLWERAGIGPDDLDVAGIYDDYPVMVLIQLEDLGLISRGDATTLLGGSGPAINTSGGQLSAGQAGAGGSLHGLVECVRQLRGERGDGQVDGAQTALVSSSTISLYRYGACAAAAVLEAVDA